MAASIGLIGFSAGRRTRQAIGDGWHLMVSTGTTSVLMGESTIGALVGAAYVLISLVVRYLAVIAGVRIGGPCGARRPPSSRRRLSA